jgi:hypothetical protein
MRNASNILRTKLWIQMNQTVAIAAEMTSITTDQTIEAVDDAANDLS